jgi:hypothetical protein
VFPCHSPAETPGGCSCWRTDCTSPGKHPRVAGGLTAASVDPATIERWWRRWPTANVAIRTGAVSGLIVLDVDPDHGGDDSLDALLRDHGPLPPGAVVRTGSGGRHFYFAHPGGVIRNDAGRRLGPGLDIRGDGGYVIAPPSRHTNGASYRWDSPDRQIPEAPGWLVARLREPLRPPPQAMSPTPEPASPRRISAWASAALERELAKVSAAQEGSRNSTLNRSAFSLGQIVGSGALDATEVEGLLLDRAAAIGLGEREARATIASGLSAGTRQPRMPADQTVNLRTIPLPGTPSSADPRTPAPKPPIAELPGPA